MALSHSRSRSRSRGSIARSKSRSCSDNDDAAAADADDNTAAAATNDAQSDDDADGEAKMNRSRSRSRSRSRKKRGNECFGFAEEGSCRFGDRCRFSHGKATASAKKREQPVDVKETNVLGIFGMSKFTTEEKLRDVFGEFGAVSKVHVVKDKHDNT
jgi:hypothetical protein